MATRVLDVILALVVAVGLALLPAAPVGAEVIFPANITLLPPSASNLVGTNHSLTAKVTSDLGDPVPGAPISWSLAGVGGFVGTPDPSADLNGEARATITSTEPGQSTVTASVEGTSLSATATKDWLPGPPDSITLVPASASNLVGTNHTVVATVKDGYGNVIPGQAVTWTIQSGPGSIVSSDPTTNASGQASATITSTQTGTTIIRATADSRYAEATKTWNQDPPPADNVPSVGQWGIIVTVAGLACSMFLATSRRGRRGATPH